MDIVVVVVVVAMAVVVVVVVSCAVVGIPVDDNFDDVGAVCGAIDDAGLCGAVTLDLVLLNDDVHYSQFHCYNHHHHFDIKM